MKGRHIFFTVTAIILPYVLLMNAVTLIFSPAFLVREYKRSDFPPDPYGFTLEERIKYGTESVNYIIDISHKYSDDYLSGLTMKDGTPLYNERETSHMYDVRVVFQKARLAMSLMVVFIIITVLLVSRHPDSLPGFLKSLLCGSSITLFLLILIGIGIATGFDAFFDGFHQLFFTNDSWYFWETDSLIRLFPEPLWIHGFTYAAVLTAIFACILLIISLITMGRIRVRKNRIRDPRTGSRRS